MRPQPPLGNLPNPAGPGCGVGGLETRPPPGTLRAWEQPGRGTPMLTAAQISLIETWRLGFVATVSADGTPNLSPKGTFVVLDPNTIAFAEMRSPGTLAALAAHPLAEVNVVDILSRTGLRIKGAARVLTRDTQPFSDHLPAFTPYWPELEHRFNAIVTIAADKVRPLSSPIYDDGAIGAELRAAWKARIAAMP